MEADENGSTDDPPIQIVRRARGSRRGPLSVLLAIVVAALILLGGAAAAGLLSPPSPSGSCPPPAATLDGAGSTLVAPLMFDWSTQYSASTVDYDSIGSGAGIAQITAKTVDFGASDAPLSPAQEAAVPAPGVLTVPESIGGVVPIYNLPGIHGILRFTGAVLAGIYLGDITRWNDPRLSALDPGANLPNAPIVVVFRSDGSGTTFIWTTFLSASNATWKAQEGYSTSVVFPVGAGAKGNAGVTQTVKSTVDALGYVDINYALTDSLAYGAVENPAGNFVLANVSNIASAVMDANVTLPAAGASWYSVSLENAPGAEDYPITSFTYLFVYKDLGQAYGSSYTQTKAENLVDFLDWVVAPNGGQSDAAALFYVPLTTAVTTFDTSAIHSISFNGAGVPLCSVG